MTNTAYSPTHMTGSASDVGLSTTPPIESALNSLEDQTRSLDNAIGMLEEKLKSVLGPSVPCPAGGSGPEKPTCNSPLHDRLRGYVAIIQSFANRVNCIRERTEC